MEGLMSLCEASKGEVVGSLKPCMSLQPEAEANEGRSPRVVIADYTSEVLGPTKEVRR